jgi:hypothetical protein
MFPWVSPGLITAVVFGMQVSIAVGSPDSLPSATAISAQALANVSNTSVHPRFTGDGHSADDTDAIQAALDTGHSVLLPANHTYLISRTLIMHGGQRLAGEGAGVVLSAKRGWVRPVGKPNGYQLLSNVGYSSTDLSDTGLVVENLTIDASEITHGNKGFHGIGFRRARDVLIRSINCVNIGDCTAILASDGTLVPDSSAKGITNVGFDHWDGPQNAMVTNVTVYVAAGGDGVMFTAASSAPNYGRSGRNLVASGAQVYGPMGVGVTANILASGGSLHNLLIENCLVDVQGNRDSPAIIINGNISDGVIRGVSVLNLNGGQAVALTPDNWGVPGNIVISNVLVLNPATSLRNVAPIVALGRGHYIVNSTIVGGSYNYPVWIDDDSTVVDGQFRNGLRGGILKRRLNRP